MRNIAFALIGVLVLGAHPALATSSSTGGRSSSNVPLARTSFDNGGDTVESLRAQERARLQDLSKNGIPSPFEHGDVMTDADDVYGDAASSTQSGIDPNSYEARKKAEAEKRSKVKQVYNPTPDMEMRRLINDPRIDDGYVQSLIRQNAR